MCVSVFCARRPVPDPLDVNQKVPRLRGAARQNSSKYKNNTLQLRDEELKIMKIIAVVDVTFAKAKRIRLWDLNVKLEQFSKTSKHKGWRTTGGKKAGSFCAAHSWIWYGGPVFSQQSGSNNMQYRKK